MKLCECGCGQPTKISHYNCPERGWVVGQPRKFLSGHNRRPVGPQYRVEVQTGGCWEWQWAMDDGYGRLVDGGRNRQAHVVFWEREHGTVPDGFQLDHVCRNRRCVNPAHLEVVTNAQNTRRGDKAKLDWAKVRAIRASNERLSVLADRYGVSISAICLIRKRKRWWPEENA